MFLLAVDAFSKFGRSVRFKNEIFQTENGSFGNVLRTSKRSPHFNEANDGKKFVKTKFTDFSNKNNFERISSL